MKALSLISKQQILKELQLVPENRLREIENYIRFIISQAGIHTKTREPKTLRGIWKGKGFEKIENLDKSIKETRKELADQITKKYGR